jgi:hypothetical protein
MHRGQYLHGHAADYWGHLESECGFHPHYRVGGGNYGGYPPGAMLQVQQNSRGFLNISITLKAGNNTMTNYSLAPQALTHGPNLTVLFYGYYIAGIVVPRPPQNIPLPGTFTNSTLILIEALAPPDLPIGVYYWNLFIFAYNNTYTLSLTIPINVVAGS